MSTAEYPTASEKQNGAITSIHNYQMKRLCNKMAVMTVTDNTEKSERIYLCV